MENWKEYFAYFDEIALSRTIKEIQAVLCFTR